MSDTQGKRIIRNKVHFSDNFTINLFTGCAVDEEDGPSALRRTAEHVLAVVASRHFEIYQLCITRIDISRKLKWVVHVECTGRSKNAYYVLVIKSEDKEYFVMHRSRWQD